MWFQASNSLGIRIARFHQGLFRQKGSQSLWHLKSQFLRQVVTVINIVTFSDTINVFTRQQDRFQRKTQKFISPIQQKIGFIFLLWKSIIPSAMALVNTEGRWSGGRTAPTPPIEPPIYFYPILTQILESFSQKQMQAQALSSTTGRWCFKALFFHTVTLLACVPLSIICSWINYERATSTQTSSYTVLP